MKKRVLSLILVCAMVMALTACSGEENQSSSQVSSSEVSSESSSEETSSESSESSSEESSEEASSVPADNADLVTLKVLCKNDYNSEIKTEDWENYDVSKIFMDKLASFGVKLEAECIANSDFDNVVNTRMASGVDMPDIVSIAFDEISKDDILSWGSNGLIIPASQLMEEYDTDGSIAAYWDKYAPGTRGAETAPDGNLYWFVYLYHVERYDTETGEKMHSESLRTPSLRQDWVEAVGETMQLCYTPDQLYDLLIKIQQQDANGNGAQDEVVDVRIDTFNDNLSRGFGLNTALLAYIDNDGKVQSNWYDDRLITYLDYMKRLYDNGLFDTASLSGDLYTSELISENRAALTVNYATWSDYENQISAEGAQYTPFVLDEDGDLSTGWYCFGDNTDMIFNQYFVTSACEHPEAAAALFDFIYTDEYALLDYAGIEGVTYTLDDKGVITMIDNGAVPEDADEAKAYRAKYSTFFSTSMGLYGLPAMLVLPSYAYSVDPNATESLQIKQTAVSEMKKYMDTCDFQKSTLKALATDEESEKLDEIGETLETYAQELLTDIILGEKSVDTLDTEVAQMEELGLKDYMDILQTRYDRAVAAGK